MSCSATATAKVVIKENWLFNTARLQNRNEFGKKTKDDVHKKVFVLLKNDKVK